MVRHYGSVNNDAANLIRTPGTHLRGNTPRMTGAPPERIPTGGRAELDAGSQVKERSPTGE